MEGPENPKNARNPSPTEKKSLRSAGNPSMSLNLTKSATKHPKELNMRERGGERVDGLSEVVSKRDVSDCRRKKGEGNVALKDRD